MVDLRATFSKPLSADRLELSMNKLGLNDWLVKQCKAMGIVKPTDIQESVIPKILEGIQV